MRLSGRLPAAGFEVVLATKHLMASMAGFAVDFVMLHVALGWGLEPAWARVVSLGAAVNATFAVNKLVVFRDLAPAGGLARRWLAYVGCNAFGNLCNYWIFVTLVSLHHPVVSAPTAALCLAAASAWAINYAAARLLIFGKGLRGRAAARRRARAGAAAPNAPSVSALRVDPPLPLRGGGSGAQDAPVRSGGAVAKGD